MYAMETQVLDACARWENELRRRRETFLRRRDIELGPKKHPARSETSSRTAQNSNEVDGSEPGLQELQRSEDHASSREIAHTEPMRGRAGAKRRETALQGVSGGARGHAHYHQGPVCSESPPRASVAAAVTITEGEPCESVPAALDVACKENADTLPGLAEALTSRPIRNNPAGVRFQPLSSRNRDQPLTSLQELRGVYRARYTADDANSQVPREQVIAPEAKSKSSMPLLTIEPTEPSTLAAVPSPNDAGTECWLFTPDRCEGKHLATEHMRYRDAQRNRPASLLSPAREPASVDLEWRGLFERAQHEFTALSRAFEGLRTDRERLARDVLTVLAGCRHWWQQLEKETQALAESRADLARDVQIFREFTTNLQRQAVRLLQRIEDRFQDCMGMQYQQIAESERTNNKVGIASKQRNEHAATSPHQNKQTDPARLENPSTAARWASAGTTPDDGIEHGTALDARLCFCTATPDQPTAEQCWLRRFAWLQQELAGLRQQLAEQTRKRTAHVSACTAHHSQTGTADKRSTPDIRLIQARSNLSGFEDAPRLAPAIPDSAVDYRKARGFPVTSADRWGTTVDPWEPEAYDAFDSMPPADANHDRALGLADPTHSRTQRISAPQQREGMPRTRAQAAGAAGVAPMAPQLASDGGERPPAPSATRSSNAGVHTPSHEAQGDDGGRWHVSGRSDALPRSLWSIGRTASSMTALPSDSVARRFPARPNETPTVRSAEQDEAAPDDLASGSLQEQVRSLLLYIGSLQARTSDSIRLAQLATLHRLIEGMCHATQDQDLILSRALDYLDMLLLHNRIPSSNVPGGANASTAEAP